MKSVNKFYDNITPVIVQLGLVNILLKLAFLCCHRGRPAGWVFSCQCLPCLTGRLAASTAVLRVDTQSGSIVWDGEDSSVADPVWYHPE